MGTDKAEGTRQAVIPPQTGDGSTPSTPSSPGKKRKRSGKPRKFPIPLVKVTKWTGQQTETHDIHLKLGGALGSMDLVRKPVSAWPTCAWASPCRGVLMARARGRDGRS